MYANSLLLHWQHSPATVVPLVRQVFPALMEQPYGTVHQLLLCTWPELQVLLHVSSLHLFLVWCTVSASSFLLSASALHLLALHTVLAVSALLCLVNPACIFSLLWVPSLQKRCPFTNSEMSTWPGLWNVHTAFVTSCDNAIGSTPHGLCAVTSRNADMSSLCSMSEWLYVRVKRADSYGQAADVLTSYQVAQN